MRAMNARAVRIREAGGPEVLELGKITVRPPGPHEVRIAVRAAGLNRADCLQRRGIYPAPKGTVADVPGLEYAGEVEACGEAVTDLEPGQRVMGIVAGGSMATLLVAHERECVPMPKNMSFEDAAAIPEAFFTAYDALVLQGAMAGGDHVLIHAAGSGVGTAAIQIARALGGRTIGTSRTAGKLTRCTELGLDHGLHTPDGTFAKQIREFGGADLILDTIGAKYLNENLASLRTGGRIVVIGLLGGIKGELDLGKLLSKRATLHGSVLRSRPLEEKITLAQLFTRRLLPLFERGALRPVVDTVMDMEEIQAAHTRMESGQTFGKLVLRWS
ncbi:MAG: NADPH2:quinone reductase [Polyangiales bacterium]|jgi:NADPH2:quinone reductase